MPEYVVEIPMRITVTAPTAYEGYQAAFIRADHLVSLDDGASIPHHERGYAPSRVRESMRSRQARMAAGVTNILREEPKDE